MIDLDEWMNGLLVSWGFPHSIADSLDEVTLAVMLLVLCILLNYLLESIFIKTAKRIVKHTKAKWDDLLIEHKVVQRLVNAIPAFVFFEFAPLAFVHRQGYLIFSQRVCAMYIVIVIVLALNGVLNVLHDISKKRDNLKKRPIKGVIQVFQVILFFIGGIIVISIIINKSPATLFAGLGASAAILMLVFKDTILGFVAGIQLSANDMVHVGDWISMPSANANGIVKEITLNTVKVQNWDNTITTIPPVTLVNNSFQNYRGMQESDGRLVNKTISLDLKTIHFCTPEMIDQIRKDVPLMKDYTPKQDEQPTNSQLFRYYAERYLRTIPEVNQKLDLIVTQQQTTEYGLPLKIYFFSSNKVWKDYESIQSNIFDHLLAIVPQFGLKVYQYS